MHYLQVAFPCHQEYWISKKKKQRKIEYAPGDVNKHFNFFFFKVKTGPHQIKNQFTSCSHFPYLKDHVEYVLKLRLKKKKNSSLTVSWLRGLGLTKHQDAGPAAGPAHNLTRRLPLFQLEVMECLPVLLFPLLKSLTTVLLK